MHSSSSSHLSFLWIVVCIVACSIIIAPTAAQFGIPQQKQARDIQNQLLASDKENDNVVVNMLLQVASQHDDQIVLTEQNAMELALMLQQAANDEDTQELIARMRMEERDTLQQLKNTASVKEVMSGLVHVLEEMKMLEVLFQDQERALQLMTEEGMVDPSRIKEYKKNPALLEDDTRKGLYFSFCTLAVTAGFL